MATALYTIPLANSGPVPEEVLVGAACKGSWKLFFGEGRGGKASFESRVICASCPVKQQCLDYALPIAGLFGVWGGLDEQQRGIERRRRGYVDAYHNATPRTTPVRRQVQEVAPSAACPSEAQYRLHRRRGEDCPACRQHMSAVTMERRRRRGGR